MPAALKIRTDAGDPVPDLTALAETQTGQAGAPLDLQVINEGDEPSSEGAVRLLARADALSSWQADGLPPLDEGWIEVSLDSGPWAPLGAGRLVLVPDLAVGEAIAFQVRQNPPAGPVDATYQYALQVLTGGATSIPGVHLPAGAGVVIPLHDSEALVWWQAPQAVAGAGAGVVDIAGWAWFAARRFHQVPAVTVTLDGLDGAGAALAAGESYAALLSAAPDGTISTTKGLKGAAPLDEGARPAVPAGHLAGWWVERDDAGGVALTAAHERAGFFGAVAVGTTLQIGPGAAILGCYGPERRAGQDAALPVNATSWIWLLPQGGHAVTQADLPPAANPEALALYRATTDAASITELVDLRRWVGAHPLSLTFHLDGVLVVDQAAHGSLPPGIWNLQPTGALHIFLESGGSAAGGGTVFDLEYRDGGGAWLSLFPTQTGAVPDHGESVPFDEVQSIGDGLPEVLVVGGPALLRLRVAALPDTPAPAPSGAWGRVVFWG